jgi:SIR2-like domain
VCDGDAVTIPPSLIAAVTRPGGDQIALVLGAGCSMDAPTNLETAGAYARRAYRELVARGLIPAGCCDENDLGALGDAVFDEQGSQKHLVDILRPLLSNAAPNDGHKIAAALLVEGIVGLILTLNFDRAMDIAMAMIAGGANITIVHEAEDLAQRTRRGLVYLHGNVESEDEKWVLRSSQIGASWDDKWQQFVAHDFALTPNVIFAGLGSPTPVISDTVLKVRAALPNTGNVFQVDAVDRAHNMLATALAVAADAYFVSCWTGFMNAMGSVAAQSFINRLADRSPQFCAENDYSLEDLALVLAALPTNILKLGKLRAIWFFNRSEYKTFNGTDTDLMVDVILTLALAVRIVGATDCIPVEDGMEFRKDGKPVFRVFSFSGGGTMHWTAFEERLQARLQEFRKHDTTTTVVFLTTGVEMVDNSAPAKIVPSGDPDAVTTTPPDYRYFSSRMLREDPSHLMDMVKP